MKKNRVIIALLPILILICVPIQNQNLPEEETHDSVSQLLRLQRIEDLETTGFIEKENKVDYVFTSLTDTSNSENKPQKTSPLGDKGINKAINSIKGVTAYVEHPTIEILNNSAFGPTGYDFNGNGQSDNPYQIIGYNITDSSTTLIHIENTTAYFRIANNYLNGSGGSNIGIDLENVTHGLIENNTICNIFDGIILDESHHNTVFNNSFIDTPHDGLALQDSSNYNNITNNVINDCGRGISLSSSDNNTVWNNTINDASYTGDIDIYSSNYNVVLNNTLYNAYSGIILDTSSRYNTLQDNTIFNQTSQGIRIQSSSNNNSIIDNTIYDITDSTGTGIGIYMTSSHNNTLSGNTIYNITDDHGISLSSSTYSTLHDNTIFSCYGEGINLVSSSHNSTILANRISKCNSGLRIYDSHNNTILKNIIYDCVNNYEGGTTGISMSFSNFNYMAKNTIYNFTNSQGIYIHSCHNNTLFDNNITIGASAISQGIRLYDSDNNTIQSNTISNLTISQGIYLLLSHNNSFSLNVIYYCDRGIFVYSSSDNTLFANNISNNYNYALTIDNASVPAYNNLVEWNTFINNNFGGPHVYVATYTSGNTLRYNYYDDHTSTDTNNDGFFDTPYYAQPSPSVDRTDSYPRTHPYFYHDTLYIVGNEGFETLGFPGNGTSSNPYLIGNYYFVNTSLLALIYIQDTNVYFRITSNILNGFDQNYNCIELNNVTHGTIDNNIICNTTDHGIRLDDSPFNNISNNFVHYCVSGPMMFQYSGNNTIKNNIVNNSDGGGFWLDDDSNYNVFSNNTIENCYGGGFQLWGPVKDTIIQNNSIAGCYLGGIRLVSEATDNYILDNIIDNCHNGGLEIHSDRNHIQNNSIAGCYDGGILFYESAIFNQVLNNTIYNCYAAGIDITSSSNNNTFSYNKIEACYYGVHLQSTSNFNRFYSNTIYTCEDGDLIYIESSNNNIFYGNNITDGYLNAYGIRLYSSNYTTISYNTIYECDNGGILLYNSHYTNISYNNLFNNSNYAISLTSTSNNNSINWNNFVNSVTGNTPQAYDVSTNNTFSYNYWDEWTTPDIVAPYGIVDVWYNLDGSTNNNDTSPLTTPVIPTVLILSPVLQDYGTDTITVTLSGYVEHYWYYITGDTNNQTWSESEDRILADGTYTLHAYGNDTLGNTAYVSVTFTIDTIAPDVSINNPLNTTYYQANVFLNYTVSDGTVTIYIDAEANSTSLYSKTMLPSLSDGLHNITIVTVDQAGNINKTTVLFTINTMAPIITLETPSNNTAQQSGTVIDVAITDINLDTVLFNWNGTSNNTWSGSYQTFLPANDVQHFLYVYANDSSGNWSSRVFIFTTDDTSPTVSITSPIGSTTYNQDNFTLSYTVSDGTVTIYLNGYANTTAIPSGTTVTGIPDGTYNLTIIAVDQAGNVGKVTILGTIDTSSSSSSSSTSSSTTSKKGSFPGFFVLVIFFTLPVVVIRRYRRIKKKIN